MFWIVRISYVLNIFIIPTFTLIFIFYLILYNLSYLHFTNFVFHCLFNYFLNMFSWLGVMPLINHLFQKRIKYNFLIIVWTRGLNTWIFTFLSYFFNICQALSLIFQTRWHCFSNISSGVCPWSEYIKSAPHPSAYITRARPAASLLLPSPHCIHFRPV